MVIALLAHSTVRTFKRLAERMLCALFAAGFVLFGALTLVAMFAVSPVHAAEAAFKWEHFGADPYATSREEGMRTRESAFRALGLPEEVIAIAMIATDKPGEKIRLVNGDHLDVMLSKGGVAHRNVSVAFVRPPVNGKMEYAAPAEKWQVTSGGKTYTVILPEVCNNWSVILPLVPLQPVMLAKAPVAKVTGACPNGFTLVGNAWSLAAMPEGIRSPVTKLIREAEERESENAMRIGAYAPDDLSRTFGGQLRREVRTRLPVTVDLQVRLLDPQTLVVVEDLGVLHLSSGMGSITLTYDQHLRIVETIWPGDFVSPTVSGAARRLRLFPAEWGKWCEMNIHGAKP